LVVKVPRAERHLSHIGFILVLIVVAAEVFFITR
jgi:hypothetical protein